MELLHWAATTDPVIKSIFEDSAGNANYLSHDIQNELINLMSNEIREDISLMVRLATFVHLSVKIKPLYISIPVS